MVIECKRVRQTEWVFLIPNPEPGQRDIQRYPACLWYSALEDARCSSFDWINHNVIPCSFESQFCAIPGQEQGRRNLLERTAAELINATESFARQERELQQRKTSENLKKGSQPLNFFRLYIPVIVTTAKLIISQFDPGAISLEDGSLPPESTFEPVPVVRFRKSFTTKLTPSALSDIMGMHEMTQRTVFVVNAEKFHEFLGNWNVR